MRGLVTLLFLAAVLALPALSAARPSARSASPYGRVAFPRDASVIDARRDLGARGDGVADDTDALQKGIEMSCGDPAPSRVLYLPNGTYRVTRTLVVKSRVGPWMYGESRDGTIIRLADGVQGVNSVLRTHPNEDGPTSADWFMRNFRNFTIDAGNNPGTDGIRWCSTNTGILQNLKVVGNGKIGINAGFIGQSSPNLIQDVVVEGFEEGVRSQWNWGETLSRVTVRNCRKLGVYVNATVVALEDLTVENTPQALFCDYPNDWTWWGGVVSLVGGRFTGGDPGKPAVLNRSILYARDVRADGFKRVLESETPGGSVPGGRLDEYSSHPARRLFDAPERSLRLPVRREPRPAWETDPGRWLCANGFGVVAGDDKDDTAALQKAIDAAARQGKTTVYLRGVGGGDPNWYNVEGEVKVHGSVRRIIALGFGRVLGEKGRFVVTDESAPSVVFQNLDAFGGPPVTLENRSSGRALLAESCGVRILGTGTGDLYVTDCPASVELTHPGQKLWARHLNPEGDSDTGLVRNAGGDAWILGMKSEGRGVRLRTSDGGRTELFGMFNYGSPYDEKDPRPLFDVDEARFSLLGLRELVFGGSAAPVKVRERRGGMTRTLRSDRESGWIGWSMYSGHAAPEPSRR